MKNKNELYNAIVNLTKKTGQGLTSKVVDSKTKKILNELIAEGLIKKVRSVGTIQDDWYCLTAGYCVEEDCYRSGNLIELEYVRKYLGQKPKTKFETICRQSIDIEKYNIWLEKIEINWPKHRASVLKLRLKPKPS
jgi:hypothetical protein